ncbi:MAG: hypothetical protein AAF224_03920 [Pseudomonadota bacterium]
MTRRRPLNTSRTNRRHSARFAGVAVAGIATLWSVAANADTGGDERNRFAVGLYGGALGLGGDIQARTTDWLVLRAGGHWFDISIDEEYDGVDYDGDVGLSNAFLTADFHPFTNGWFISAGLVLGAKTIDLSATPAAPVEIGDQIFTPEQVGVLTGAISANDAAPFIGLGFDNAVTSDNRIGWSFLVGAAFTGESDVALTATDGLLADDPNFQAQLALEEDNLREDVDDYSVYPVARLGVTLGF